MYDRGCSVVCRFTLNVTVRSYSLNHIDELVGNFIPRRWRFSGIYVHPTDENKYKTVALLESLCDDYDFPWVCVEGV